VVHLSIVIPAYNEEKRIGATLDKIYDFLSSKNYNFEVIVVDDGSMDRTVDVAAASRLSQENKLRVLKNAANRGKGFSVKTGIINSNGEYILFSDADLSTPIEEVDKLIEYVKKDYDVVIGSRSVTGSKVIVHQLWYRELMGKVFNLFVKLLLISEFRDTQCGFKLFRGSVAHEIAGLMKINGFTFDVEMLYIAKSKGYKIKEVGVSWENSTESKVGLFHSPASMFLDLFRIKIPRKSSRVRR
jgi:dolichyl-phosphate beta-glucosyltransferase